MNKIIDSYLRETCAEMLAYDPGLLFPARAADDWSHLYVTMCGDAVAVAQEVADDTREDIPGKGKVWPCPWEFHSPGGIALGRGPTGLGGLRLLGSAAMLLRNCLKSFLLPKPPTADSHVGK